MARRRGRPEQVTDGRWRHSEILGRRVVTIIRRRDSSDAETITEVTTRLQDLASRVLRPRVLSDDSSQKKVTFKDVAGVDEASEELHQTPKVATAMAAGATDCVRDAQDIVGLLI